MSENIKTLWRLAYIKLFNYQGKIARDKYVYLDDGEYRRLLWLFYWRTN